MRVLIALTWRQSVGAGLDLPFVKGLYAVAWVGLMQRFWRIAGQSPVDFEDPLLGVGYRH